MSLAISRSAGAVDLITLQMRSLAMPRIPADKKKTK